MPEEQNIISPETAADDGQKRTPDKPGRWLRFILWGIPLFFALVISCLIIFIYSDLGGNFLDNKVEASLQKKIGKFAGVTIRGSRLSLDDDYHLALKVDSTPIKPFNDKIEISKLGYLRFGFAMMPLLHRKIEVIQLEADNASIKFHKQDNGKSIFDSLPHDNHQRVDFDAVTDLVFSSVNNFVHTADKMKINTFRFSNINFAVISGSGEQNFTVKQFSLRRLRESVQLKAEIVWLGQPVTIAGSAALNEAGQAQNFTITAENIPARLGAPDSASPYLPNGRTSNSFFRLRGLADVNLSGSADTGDKKWLSAKAELKQAHSDISIDANIPTAAKLNVDYHQGSGEIAVSDSSLSIGGAQIPLSGAFGYKPETDNAEYQEPDISDITADEINQDTASAGLNQTVADAGAAANEPIQFPGVDAGGGMAKPINPNAVIQNSDDQQRAAQAVIAPTAQTDGLYYFSLAGENGVSAPVDSPADALPFNVYINGLFSSLDKSLYLSSFLLKADNAPLFGKGSFHFAADKSPEIILILRANHMPVEAAKQLWPINVSHSARKWVLSHIFGGNLVNMQMEVALPQGFFPHGKPPPPLTAQEMQIYAQIENTRSDLLGTLPPLREAYGKVTVKGTQTNIYLNKALAYVDDGRQVNITDGKMWFTWIPGKPLWANLAVHINGAIGAIGKLLACDPVHAADKLPFNTQTAKGDIQALLTMDFPISKKKKITVNGAEQNPPKSVTWAAGVDFKDFTPADAIGGIRIENAAGHADLDNYSAAIKGDALLNNIPATVSLFYPLGKQKQGEENQTNTETANKDKIAELISQAEEERQHKSAAQQNNGQTVTGIASAPLTKKEQITFHIDDKIRNKLFPALNIFLKGPASAEVGTEKNGKRPMVLDLTQSIVQIPWIGWKKGAGIPARAEFSLPMTESGFKNIDIDNFALSGVNFRIAGRIHIRNGNFMAAELSDLDLNRSDKMSAAIYKQGNIYHANLTGRSFDLRSFIKSLSESGDASPSAGRSGIGVALTANLDSIQGYYNEGLYNIRAIYNRSTAGSERAMLSATTKSNNALTVQVSKNRGLQQISVVAADAGAFLRFMNYYDKVQGGYLTANLQTSANKYLSGPVHMRNFAIVNEPKLSAIVSTQKRSGVSTNYMPVENAFGQMTKGPNYLALDKGVIRGADVGATFQGVIYDSGGNIAMTGTYMPAYSVNRVVSAVPILGAVLGNGRDEGLIGVTFKLEGKFKSPKVVVNPVSAIAPGVLRSMFEFRQP